MDSGELGAGSNPALSNSIREAGGNVHINLKDLADVRRAEPVDESDVEEDEEDSEDWEDEGDEDSMDQDEEDADEDSNGEE